MSRRLLLVIVVILVVIVIGMVRTVKRSFSVHRDYDPDARPARTAPATPK